MKVYIDMLTRNVKKRLLNLITIELGSSIKIANKDENLREAERTTVRTEKRRYQTAGKMISQMLDMKKAFIET